MKSAVYASLFLRLLRLANASPFRVLTAEPDVHGEPVGSQRFWWKIAVSAVFVLLGGVFAGYVSDVTISYEDIPFIETGIRLTLGLMGLDELHLRVLSTSSDDEKTKKNAATGEVFVVIWQSGD